MGLKIVSAILLGCLFCGEFGRSAALFGGGAPPNPIAPAPVAPLGGGGLGNAGTALQGAQMAEKVVPKCAAPIDHSCDDMSFSELSDKVGGIPGIDNISQLQGGNLLGDSTMTNQMKRKSGMCDENTKPGGQFDQMKPNMDSLMSGKVDGLADNLKPQALDAGKACKNAMDTDREKCNVMKRQMCAFMKGGVQDPTKLNCAFQDMMKTTGQVQAKDDACKTADAVFKNPSNAGSTLQSGAPGIAAGLALNHMG